MGMSSVQYIIVRKDLVPQMGIGKTAAQVAHASLGAVIERVPNEIEGFSGRRIVETTETIKMPDVSTWFNGRFTKLVCYVKTKQKLINLAKKLDAVEIKYKLIYDACFTMLEPEEDDGTTLTCMGVIPINKDNVPKCLKKLQLLE